MEIQERKLLESFILIIKKKNELAQKCLKDIEKEVCDIVYDYKSYLIYKVQNKLKLYFCGQCLSTDDILQELYIGAIELLKHYKYREEAKLHTFIVNFAPLKATRNIIQKYSPSLIRIPDWKYRTRTVRKELLEPYIQYDKIDSDDNKDKNPDKKYGLQVCSNYDYLTVLDNKILLNKIWEYISNKKFSKENYMILKMKALEIPDEQIAKELNIKCCTLRSRIKKIRKLLRNEFRKEI